MAKEVVETGEDAVDVLFNTCNVNTCKIGLEQLVAPFFP